MKIQHKFIDFLHKKQAQNIYKQYAQGTDYYNKIFDFTLYWEKPAVQPEKQNKQKGERHRVKVHIGGEIPSKQRKHRMGHTAGGTVKMEEILNRAFYRQGKINKYCRKRRQMNSQKPLNRYFHYFLTLTVNSFPHFGHTVV